MLKTKKQLAKLNLKILELKYKINKIENKNLKLETFFNTFKIIIEYMMIEIEELKNILEKNK